MAGNGVANGMFKGGHAARRWRPMRAQLPIAGGEAGMTARCGIPSVNLTLLDARTEVDEVENPGLRRTGQARRRRRG
jgi:hypothetical protein